MKAISKCLVVVMILFFAAIATAQEKAPPAPAPPPAQAQQEKAFEGALVKVDTDAHMIIAKAPDNKEWQFSYTEKTQVVGPEKTVQGLAGNAGARLRITYRVDQGTNLATRIEVAN